MSRLDALDYSPLCTALHGTPLQPLADALPALVAQHFNRERWGDIPRWLDSLAQLPLFEVGGYRLDQDTVSVSSATPLDHATLARLEQALRGLHPWRKGPFDIAGVFIDTEWRSDWKWQRIAPHLDSLAGRTVLDVGCGSGYHGWRMKGAGARRVIGIEPSPLFIVQFWALQHFLQDPDVFVVPATCEDLPPDLEAFDTVFSMGVLYHRRAPFDHLLELRQLLRPGGQLVLETLVVEGDENTVLVPPGRYGRMGNVWCIPSARAVKRWLEKLRFGNVQIVDQCLTTTAEQRSTGWMTFQSLADFLDPDNPTQTVEGHPAPMRAVLTAYR